MPTFDARVRGPVSEQQLRTWVARASQGRRDPTSADVRHLDHLRAAIGTRAAGAKLLLCAPAFADDVRCEASDRADLELVDLDHLYHGD